MAMRLGYGLGDAKQRDGTRKPESYTIGTDGGRRGNMVRRKNAMDCVGQ